ncbi:hypothetical protein ACH4JS_35470 [Streptomyces sp. NPDC017638]|uniref:hypothetical protein n=1 Tax=Streptomyces sp. NPDC017638 TaxID=3365004 RepID=UPI00379EC6AD
MSEDVMREPATAGRVVLREDSARDGAQARTPTRAGFRMRLPHAHETERMFGADGPRRVVLPAGFPAARAEEAEAVRRVAWKAEGEVGVAAVCRGGRRDVEQAVASARDSRHDRVMVVVPASEATAQAMAHRTAAEAAAAGTDPVRHARDPATPSPTTCARAAPAAP